MFRITQYMREIAQPTALGPKRNPPGPVVIWNLIRRCNLTCKHCYSISADKDFAGELSTSEVYGVMDDLRGFRVPVLILSGGEPLLRPDIFDISRRAKEMGFYVGLSSNGTLIDESNIERIAEIGFDYVGVSLDGIRETHDVFRRKEGAFDASLHGVRLCREFGGGTRNNALQIDDDPVQWNRNSKPFDFATAMGLTPARVVFIGHVDGTWPVPRVGVTLAQAQKNGLFILEEPFAFMALGPSNLAERPLAAGTVLREHYTVTIEDLSTSTAK